MIKAYLLETFAIIVLIIGLYLAKIFQDNLLIRIAIGFLTVAIITFAATFPVLFWKKNKRTVRGE